VLNKNEKRVLASINFFPIFIIIAFSLILTYTFITQNNEIYQADIEKTERDFMQKHKNLVKKDVQLVYDLISYEQNNALANLKLNIQKKVDEAHQIAYRIYIDNAHLGEKVIINKIKDALRYLRFNDGRGYYFIYELEGKNILQPPTPEIENNNLWDLKDAKNNYTIRELSKIAKNQTSGYYKWYWYKPNQADKMREKIGYVKLFEPFNWFIGTGEYMVDFEEEVKKNILNRINQIKYDKENYVFIIDYDGNYVNHIKPSLLDKNQIGLKDKNGFDITRGIIKIAKNGEGFVQYFGIPETQVGEVTTKISFVKGFNKWEWAVGSGFYPQKIQHLLLQKEKELENLTDKTLSRITMISILTTLFTIILLYVFSDIIKKIFLRYRRGNQEFQEKLKELLSDKTKKLNDSMEMTNSYVAMTQTDLKGVITYASDKFCNSVGYKRAELIGKPHSVVRHPGNETKLYQKMWRTIQSGKIFKGTIRNLTKDGNDYWFEILIYPDYDKDKSIIGYTALRIDITDKKRIEKINKNLEFEIEKAVEGNREKDYALSQQSKMAAMGEMLENIAHQWRQPLSIISAAASGMKLQKDYDKLEDVQFYKSISSILNNTTHLSETINTFRDFFKSDNEKILINLKRTYFKTKELIHSKYENSDIEIVEDIQDIQLVALDSDLIQVFMNILNNAKDALESKKSDSHKLIFVTIYKDDYYAFIKIKDNAGGIPSEIINKIFDPYFTTKHKSQGTGIGLYMSTKIVTKHMNGNLKVENKTYKYEDKKFNGAEFTIRIPLKEKKHNPFEILKQAEENYCYKWDKDQEKFLLLEMTNMDLVNKQTEDISHLLYKYDIDFKVLENRDIKVYFKHDSAI